MALALIQSGLNRFGPSITNVSAGYTANNYVDEFAPNFATAAYANNIFRLSGRRLEVLGIATLVAGIAGCKGRDINKFLLVADAVTTVYLLWMGSFAAVACFVLALAFNKLGEKKCLGPLQGVYEGIQENRFYSRQIMMIITLPGYFMKALFIASMCFE